MSLIIHAPNIHLGGGRTLLLALLSALKQPAIVQLDERFGPLPTLPPEVRIIRVAPSLIARLQSEFRLRLLSKRGDTLLCFGNLPPLFRSRARVFVYLQNRYLTSHRPLAGLPWSVRTRIHVERFWLRYCLRDATPLVQTETMLHEVQVQLGRVAKVMPFLPEGHYPALPNPQAEHYDYLYVASGEPHKNHRRLIQAWILLAERGYRPTLCLTLDKSRDVELCNWIERQAEKHALRITNTPLLTRKISELYMQSGVLIYPSLFESFGLPLLEACQAGLPIIAAERDYVRDVVAPLATFDPESPLSIARAVMRHRGGGSKPVMPRDAANFLDQLSEQS